MIKTMLEKKIKESGKSDLNGKHSFFVFINGTFPNPCIIDIIYLENTMLQIYERNRDEDGFLYMQYGDQ